MNLGGHDGLSPRGRAPPRARRTDFPIVALTAHAMRGDRERFLAGGCDGYISKPISTRTFVADVAALSCRGEAAHERRTRILAPRRRHPGRRRPGGEPRAARRAPGRRPATRWRLADDGEAALAEVERQPPDCIVLDIMMPRLDGYDGLRAASRPTRAPQFVPIIMLTALSDVARQGARPGRRRRRLPQQARAPRGAAGAGALAGAHQAPARRARHLGEHHLHHGAGPREQGPAERRPLRAGGRGRPWPWRGACGLPPHEREAVAKGALLHDIGKLGVPTRCCCRTGRLNGGAGGRAPREHPELGERILLPLRSMASRARGGAAPPRAPRRHRVSRTGSSARELSLPAEIVGLANHYDDLVHEEGLSPGGRGRRACGRRPSRDVSTRTSWRRSWRAAPR